MNDKNFYPGFDITPETPIGFRLGSDCFSYGTEIRKLDAIRNSLSEPGCEGPEDVYAIMMDVGNKEDYADLCCRHLLYGAVCYAKGKLGKEPVRSQGHIHAVSAFSGQSTPEIYEIWTGKAVVYMQEYGGDDPGRCFAVEGRPGDVIVVPPYWVHATVNADYNSNMSFGAWCVRDYAFDYADVRAHKGIAWFPVYEGESLVWRKNPMYADCKLIVKTPEDYSVLGIEKGIPIYEQYRRKKELFDFVADPSLKKNVWKNFIP